jgi:hypothetical protein
VNFIAKKKALEDLGNESMSMVSIDYDNINRPKTSCGTVRQVISRKYADEDANTMVKTLSRPRTCENQETKGSFNALVDRSSKKEIDWIVKAPAKPKKEWQDYMPETLEEVKIFMANSQC